METGAELIQIETHVEVDVDKDIIYPTSTRYVSRGTQQQRLGDVSLIDSLQENCSERVTASTRNQQNLRYSMNAHSDMCQ